jgi:hypothetical protein
MIIRSHRFGIGHIFVTNADIAFPLFGNEWIKEYLKRRV